MTFDVWTQGWIPVLTTDGQREELGLGAVLERAHQITQLDEPLPTLEFGLYRTLIALVMDIHRFECLSDLEEMLELERFDSARIEQYRSENASRFDLFDAEYPFLQTKLPVDSKEKPKEIAALLQHVPSGTGATHFSHPLANSHAWSAKLCAKALTAITPFMTAGGAGYSPSINGAPPWYLLIRGDSLFKTLLLNSWGEPTESPYQALGDPAWKMKSRIEPKKEQSQYKLLEGLTWQPRIVQLIPSEGGTCTASGESSKSLVSQMYFTFGLKAAAPENWTDPQVAYWQNDKNERKKVMPRKGREPWRHLSAFTLAEQRPKIMLQLDRLMEEAEDEGEDTKITIECYGMRTDNMKIFEWRKESLSLQQGVFKHPEAEREINQAMSTLDDYSSLLRRCMKVAFREYLDRPGLLLFEQMRPSFFTGFLKQLSSSRNLDEFSALQKCWRTQVRQNSTTILNKELDRLGTRGDALVIANNVKRLYFGTIKKWEG